MTKANLHNKVAIITGAGSGIGRACALRFAQDGAVVAVNDLLEDAANATVQMINEFGGKAASYHADVTEPDDMGRMVRRVEQDFGRLDILFNNAGGAIPKATHETSVAEYKAVLALNLDAVFYGIRAALPIMIKQKGGVILSTSSGAGLNAVFQLAAYGAAKAGVISLSKNVAVEYGSMGIRANVISPGPMDTPGLRRWLDTTPGGAEQYARQIPSARLGAPDDIAYVAAFLASDEAAFVNGAVVPVDGAIHAQLAVPKT